MGRTIEWVLGAIGALVSMLMVVFFGSMADAAALVIMAGVAVTGFVGFVAIALDEKGRPRAWGSVTWVVAGVMSAMVVLAGFSYGMFLIPSAVAFLVAALLALARRERSLGMQLLFYLAGALGCVLLILGGNALSWI